MEEQLITTNPQQLLERQMRNEEDARTLAAEQAAEAPPATPEPPATYQQPGGQVS
jgi:hypothetical protein